MLHLCHHRVEGGAVLALEYKIMEADLILSIISPLFGYF